MSELKLTIDENRNNDPVDYRQSSHLRDSNFPPNEEYRVSIVSPLISNSNVHATNNNNVALTSVVPGVEDLDSKPQKSKDFKLDTTEKKPPASSFETPDVEVLQVREDNTNIVGLDATDRAKSKAAVNYAAKKRVAQGMIDIALLTSNASQLRNLVESQARPWTYVITLALIILSILLQIAVGVMLIFKGHFDAKAKRRPGYEKNVNNSVMAAVFLITIINIFIASFSPVRDAMPASTSPI